MGDIGVLEKGRGSRVERFDIATEERGVLRVACCVKKVSGTAGEIDDGGAEFGQWEGEHFGPFRWGEPLGLAFIGGVAGAVEEVAEDVGVNAAFLHRKKGRKGERDGRSLRLFTVQPIFIPTSCLPSDE